MKSVFNNGGIIGKNNAASNTVAAGVWSLDAQQDGVRGSKWPAGTGSSIVSSGLVLHLDAGNTSSYPGTGTTWFDLSTNEKNGSLINSPSFSSDNNGIFTFNGTNNYVLVTSPFDFSTNNQLTASVWARSAVTNWNSLGMLVSKRNQFIIHPSSGRTVDYYVNTTTGGFQNISHTPTDITTFNNYTMTYNAGSLIAYFNGTQVSSGSVGVTLSSDTGNIEIGKDETLSRYLNGSIACVHLYSRALAPAEVQENFDALKTRFGL